MSERRFVIKEVPPTGAPHDFSITLTELKARLDHAWGAAFSPFIPSCAPSDTWDWDKAIDILLYGDGEKGEEVWGLSPIDLMDGRVDNCCKPSPTHTREEWEMFAHNLANAIYFRADEPTLTKRILSMPIVPKEDE